MENDQSIVEQIINVLRKTNATIKDLTQTIDHSENVIRVTVNRMKRRGIIRHTGRFINRFKLYRLAKPEELERHEYELVKKILIKIILPFAKSGITVELLPSEQERIEELFQDNYNASGIRKKGD